MGFNFNDFINNASKQVKDGFGDIKKQVNDMIDDEVSQKPPVKGNSWICKCGNRVGSKYEFCPVCGTAREEIFNQYLDNQAKHELKTAKENVANLLDEREEFRRIIGEKNKEISSLQDKISNLLYELSGEKNLNSNYKMYNDDLNNKLIEKEKNITLLKNMLSEKENELISLKNSYESSIRNMKDKIQHLTAELNRNDEKDKDMKSSTKDNQNNEKRSVNNQSAESINDKPIEEAFYYHMYIIGDPVNQHIDAIYNDERLTLRTMISDFMSGATLPIDNYQEIFNDQELQAGLKFLHSKDDSDDVKALKCFRISFERYGNPEALGLLGEMYEYQYGTDKELSDYELLKKYFIASSHLGSGRGSFRAFNIYDRHAVFEILHNNIKKAELYIELAKMFISIATKQNNYMDNLGIIELYRQTGSINSEKILRNRR